MKQLVFLIAFLFAASTMYAQHNQAVDNSANYQATVIAPFSIWDVTPNGNPMIGDVIKGQIRTFNPGSEQDAGAAKLFEMSKAANREVRLTLTLPNPNDYVKIKAQWYFLDELPQTTSTWPSTPKEQIGQTFRWFDVQTTGFIAILISEIDASDPAVTTGNKTFTASVTGQYHGI